MLSDPEREVWRRVLTFDEVSHAFWANREDWPGVAVFTNTLDDAGNVAVLHSTPEDDVDALIERLIRHYRSVGMMPRVRVTPLSEPTDWPSRLAQHGFLETTEHEVFMRLVGDLAKPANPLVCVRRAPQEISVETFVETQSAGFGFGGNAERSIEAAYRNLETHDYYYFVAELGGVSVGAASMLYGDGVVGLWGLATLEPYRRQGISTTLLHRIVAEGRQRGADIIYLSAEPNSYAHRFYRTLGFVDLFTVDTFELPPGETH